MALGDYNAGIKKEGQIRISPSQVGMLSDNEMGWYKNNVLGESSFSGNTATRIGTITHYYVEAILKGIQEPNDSEVIDYLNQQNEADQWRVMDESKAMVKAFKESYKKDITSEVLSEHWLEFEPNEEVIISGTADIIMGDTIIDLKTTGKMKSSIGDYWLQLYTLAYIARKNGMEVNNVGVIYLVSPNKTMGARYTYVVEPINEDRMEYFITWLQTKVKKILYAKKNNLAELIMSNNLLSFRT